MVIIRIVDCIFKHTALHRNIVPHTRTSVVVLFTSSIVLSYYTLIICILLQYYIFYSIF